MTRPPSYRNKSPKRCGSCLHSLIVNGELYCCHGESASEKLGDRILSANDCDEARASRFVVYSGVCDEWKVRT